jgi:uncharacterized membrane protein YbhN (UPF0104 family)
VLGTVILERLADAIAVIILLVFGLAFATFKGDASTLEVTAMVAAGAIGAVIAGLLVAVFFRDRLLRGRFRWLSDRLEILSRSVTALNPLMVVAVCAMTFAIWFLEVAAVALVMSGFAVSIDLAGLALICGASNLSTLLPSAPGYVGSLQAAFVLAFSALGLEPVLGLLSATAVQLVLLGPLTVVGLLMLLAGNLRGVTTLIARNARGDG